MPAIPDAVAIRGEWISLLIVAVVLAASARPLSGMLALPRNEVGDLFWNGGVAFVVVGRLVYVALESPEALTDPLVLIRIQGGIEPIAGVAAVAAVLAWRTRRDAASRIVWLALASAGLVVATTTYDLSCVARDACYGIDAPAPLGFAMADLSDTRLATPLIEAAQAFGATPRQLLWKVELPYAFPQIMAGLNQTIMLSLSMVVIAALVGADGLGVPVVRALNQVNTALGFESGFVIVVLAIILDRMLRIERK